MKFGCEFQRLQVPQWADAYINYDALKRRLKRDYCSKNDLDTFDFLLEEEFRQVNQFLEKQLAFLNHWIEAIFSRFSLSATSTGDIQDFAQIAIPELHELHGSLGEILEYGQQLEAFTKLNQNVVQRLAEKQVFATAFRGLTSRSENLLFKRPWVDMISGLKHLSTLVEESMQLGRDDSLETQSLLLKGVSPVSLGCTSDEVHRSIKNDDSSALMCVMASPVSYLENQAMLYSVLQVAIIYQAPKCIQSLLEEITAPMDNVGCGHQDALHQFVEQTCRSRTQILDLGMDLAGLSVLEETFRELSPYQHHMLLTKDWRQRYPLHYAAHHGLDSLCSQIIKFMEPSAILQPDISGQSPLQLAVCSGHLAVVKLFLDMSDVSCMISERMAGSLLSMAIRSSFVNVAKRLVKLGKGFTYGGKWGRTPLYEAARHGQVEVIEAVLARSACLDLDSAEASKGWTPLIVACVHEHLEVVNLLLPAGVDISRKDLRGWSAVEHAAYRAHMTIANVLQKALESPNPEYLQLNTLKLSAPSRSANMHRPTCFSTSSTLASRDPRSTSYFVSLGSFDLRQQQPALELGPNAKLPSQMLLQVSASPCKEEPYQIHFPYLGDLTDITWPFTTLEPKTMTLTFKLFRYGPGGKPDKRPLATAIAMLDSIRGWFRPGRQSLHRESTVALVSPDGDFVGSVMFSFLVCSPYTPPGTPQLEQKLLFSQSTNVVGHRGLGWNGSDIRRMQIGEHTLQSFESALNQGADYIEFDVQITRDLVPVIYHDWHVSETGLDVPIHSMTFAQWMAISDAQTKSHHEAKRGRLPWDERARPSAPPRRDSRSLNARADHHGQALAERYKHTVEYARSHNKGNLPGDCIYDTFVTLRQLFEKFPEEVSFDIELKYPMVWECPYWEMEPYWIEMNQYIDATLDMVFELAGAGSGGGADGDGGGPRRPPRSIFFSCFNPEVCVLLATKQRTFPVAFLSDSMSSGPAGDSRATSLQQALRFCRRWGLQGVVMAAEPFVAAPRLIRVVREEEGLVCGSYGSLNDVPEYAKKQAAEGLDMMVVNNVRLITNTLRNMGS